MQQLYFALDLRDDRALIAQYEEWHRPDKIWPEIVESLRTAGVSDLRILRCGNRLIMVIEASAEFSITKLAALQTTNPRVREWEELMWRFQSPLPFAGGGEKWVPMTPIFSLRETLTAQKRDAPGTAMPGA
jgi:L-rhamnose mutarotase